jgi:hypothetical protein
MVELNFFETAKQIAPSFSYGVNPNYKIKNQNFPGFVNYTGKIFVILLSWMQFF